MFAPCSSMVLNRIVDVHGHHACRAIRKNLFIRRSAASQMRRGGASIRPSEF